MESDNEKKDRELAEKLFGRVIKKNKEENTREVPVVSNQSTKTFHKCETEDREPQETPADQCPEKLSNERIEQLAQLVADVVCAQTERAVHEKTGKKLN